MFKHKAVVGLALLALISAGCASEGGVVPAASPLSTTQLPSRGGAFSKCLPGVLRCSGIAPVTRHDGPVAAGHGSSYGTGARHTLFSSSGGLIPSCPDGTIWDSTFDSCDAEFTGGGVDGSPSGGPGTCAGPANPVTGQGCGSGTPCTQPTAQGGCPVSRLGNNAEPGDNCNGAGKDIGGWLGGTGDNGGNEINNVYEVQLNTQFGSETVGWVYQTFTSGYWFQPDLSLSGSAGTAAVNAGVSVSTPTVPIGGVSPSQIQGAMSAWDAFAGIASSALPPPWNVLVGGTQPTVSACYTHAWNGQYPS